MLMTTRFETVDREANTVYAGPESGTAANAEFRKLILADLPPIPPPSYVSCNMVNFGQTMSAVNGTAGGDGYHTSFFSWYHVANTANTNFDGGLTNAISFEHTPSSADPPIYDGLRYVPKIRGIYSVSLTLYGLTVRNSSNELCDEFAVIGKNIAPISHDLNVVDHTIVALVKPPNAHALTANPNDRNNIEMAHGTGTVFMNGETDFISFMFKTRTPSYNYDKLNNIRNLASIRLLTRC